MNRETALIANSMLSVRDQFPALGNWHYLDSAATAQKPQAVIDAITEAYARDYATVHRGVYERSASMTDAYERSRASASNLIGGEPNELIFTRGDIQSYRRPAQRAGLHPRRDGSDQPGRAHAAEGGPQPRPPVAARTPQQHRTVAARRL